MRAPFFLHPLDATDDGTQLILRDTGRNLRRTGCGTGCGTGLLLRKASRPSMMVCNSMPPLADRPLDVVAATPLGPAAAFSARPCRLGIAGAVGQPITEIRDRQRGVGGVSPGLRSPDHPICLLLGTYGKEGEGL